MSILGYFLKNKFTRASKSSPKWQKVYPNLSHHKEDYEQ
jgi:hypothetical protein